MKSLEDDLTRLEQLLRQLEHEYEQFFSGAVRGEPQRTDADVQRIIKQYSSRAIQNPSLRFRYTNIVARYNSFRNVWTRRVREIEEGRVFGRPTRVSAPPPARPPSSPAGSRREFVTADLRSDQKDTKEIFESYKALRASCGESTERLRLESFTRILANKVSKVKDSRNCEQVEIRLRRDHDKTRILVRPHRSDG
jgi:hypothetical protein